MLVRLELRMESAAFHEGIIQEAGYEVKLVGVAVIVPIACGMLLW